MTVCTWDAPGILEDCRAIRDAEKDQQLAHESPKVPGDDPGAAPRC